MNDNSFSFLIGRKLTLISEKYSDICLDFEEGALVALSVSQIILIYGNSESEFSHVLTAIPELHKLIGLQVERIAADDLGDFSIYFSDHAQLQLKPTKKHDDYLINKDGNKFERIDRFKRTSLYYYSDTVKIIAAKHPRFDSIAWIIGISDASLITYRQFPEGNVYSVEFEDGSAEDFHESELELAND